MSDSIRWPAPGCIAEYIEGNAVKIALITEESGGQLRLLHANRREARLPAARLLPWLGPSLGAVPGKDDAARILEEHRKKREELAAAVPVMDVWEMAQGEVETAPALWFAELFTSAPDTDHIAAYGRALLACKSHFRFQPPDFQVFSAETVEKRLTEEHSRQERETLIAGGAAFFRLLWDAACKRQVLPAEPEPGVEYPGSDVANRLKAMLFDRMADPESREHDTLWLMLSKGLPDVPHLPLQLLVAWGHVPAHYNFWLDRADYAAGDSWWHDYRDEVDALTRSVHEGESAPAEGIQMPADTKGTLLADKGGQADLADQADSANLADLADMAVESAPAPTLPAPAALPLCELPFISIDGADTRDVDDAYFVEEGPNGALTLTLALACPALNWPFGGPLDKAVFKRGTSIYLPEGHCHMLPEQLGTDAFSLKAGTARPALCVRTTVEADGSFGLCELFTARVRLAANLTYSHCQAVLDAAGRVADASAPDAEQSSLPALADMPDLAENPAYPYARQLILGLRLARARQTARIADGAVIMERPEPSLLLHGESANITVELQPDPQAADAQMLVAEMMILASAGAALWAQEHNVPMLHRVQDVALPREYAGVWTSPQDMTRIMRALTPSSLDIQARPHAALALSRYAPLTSPLRRYPDLLNEAQVVYFLHTGAPFRDAAGLAALHAALSPALEAAGQVQRFRPRYWKLVYFRQHGDKVWWDGIITEENDSFVSVSLPDQGFFARGKRRLFDERACPGMAVSVRIGKVHPLYNEVYILEATASEQPEGQADPAHGALAQSIPANMADSTHVVGSAHSPSSSDSPDSALTAATAAASQGVSA